MPLPIRVSEIILEFIPSIVSFPDLKQMNADIKKRKKKEKIEQLTRIKVLWKNEIQRHKRMAAMVIEIIAIRKRTMGSTHEVKVFLFGDNTTQVLWTAS